MRASARCEPTKPAPPVIRTFFLVIVPQSSPRIRRVLSSSDHRRFGNVILHRISCLPSAPTARRGVSCNRPFRELCKAVWILRWTRVVGGNAKMLRREAQGKRSIEGLKSLHLTVEPSCGVLTKAIRPTYSRSHVSHIEPVKPLNRRIQRSEERRV